MFFLYAKQNNTFKYNTLSTDNNNILIQENISS